MHRFTRRPLRNLLTLGLVSTTVVLGAALPAQAADSGSGPGGAVGSTSPARATQPVSAPSAPQVLATTDAANARIAHAVSVRRHDSVLGGNVGIQVFDTATWNTIYKHNATRSFRVASNTKLVTAATALQTMGPGRTFPTTVVLGQKGHVYIVGGGDPLLSSTTLRSLASTAASALKARGLTHVTVNLDDTLFARWSFPGGFDKYCPENHVSRNFCITPVRALTYDRHSHYDNAKDAAAYFTSHLNAASRALATYGGRAKAPHGVIGVSGPTGATFPIPSRATAGTGST